MFDFACHCCVKDYLGITCITNHIMDIMAGYCFDISSGTISSPPAIKHTFCYPSLIWLAVICDILKFFSHFCCVFVLLFALSPSLVLSTHCCSFPKTHLSKVTCQSCSMSDTAWKSLWGCDLL